MGPPARQGADRDADFFAVGRDLLGADMIEMGVRWFGEQPMRPLYIAVVAEETPATEPSRLSLAERAGALRAEIKASTLPRWPRQAASVARSLAKRAGAGP